MQRRLNTGAMPILPMITLLREFLIVLCALCVPQVDSSLYQIKHCLSLGLYGKYSTQRVVYFPYSTCGSALSNTHTYIYIYMYHFHTSDQRLRLLYINDIPQQTVVYN